MVTIAPDNADENEIFFLFLHENINCGYSLEAPHRGASNEYPQHRFLCRNKKNIIQIPLLSRAMVHPVIFTVTSIHNSHFELEEDKHKIQNKHKRK